MLIDDNTVAVDRDVIQHLAQTRLPENRIIEDVRLLFDGHNKNAVVHPLIYKNEVIRPTRVEKRFFSEKIIQVPKLPEVYQSNELMKQFYIDYFMDMYRFYFGEEFSSESDVFSKWEKDRSLGEMHSLAMCLTCGCHMFISDDGDSKELNNFIESKLEKSIKVFNRDEAFKNLPDAARLAIPGKERNKLSHERCN